MDQRSLLGPTIRQPFKPRGLLARPAPISPSRIVALSTLLMHPLSVAIASEIVVAAAIELYSSSPVSLGDWVEAAPLQLEEPVGAVKGIAHQGATVGVIM